jgi:hypothetical protein
MAQAHYLMAYLSFTQDKWLLAAKLFVTAAADFESAAAAMTQGEGEGVTIHRDFKCASWQFLVECIRTYRCRFCLATSSPDMPMALPCM